ncbi:hypothetical protein [Marinifilum fragile]|uniref:hypothetical protein n=1 Tax=Marinifilum fragile TaxID=570161 RepID=UPI001C4589D6|nr:hypothetical protein [Marinifilum fragile]
MSTDHEKAALAMKTKTKSITEKMPTIKYGIFEIGNILFLKNSFFSTLKRKDITTACLADRKEIYKLY